MEDKANLLVSIIVPVYNVKPYLEEAINSVINQTYKNLEIIIIDDGSTDGSGEICENYIKTDPRIKVIHQKNQGLSAARNVGLDVMTGDIVAFLDSDDAIQSDMIESMVSAIDQEDVDIVVCKYAVLYTEKTMEAQGKGRPTISSGIYDRADAMRALVDGKLNVSVWNKLYRSKIWRKIRFPVGMVYEDNSIILPVLYETKKILVLQGIYYLHRKRSRSITETTTPQYYRNWVSSFNQFESFIEDHTPDVFSIAQIQKVHKDRIVDMILLCSQMIYQRGINHKEIIEIRKDILIYIQRMTLDYPFKVWCIIQIFHFFPRLLKILYPLYHSHKKRIAK